MVRYRFAGLWHRRLSAWTCLACLLLLPATSFGQFVRSAHFGLETQQDLAESVVTVFCFKVKDKKPGTAVTAYGYGSAVCIGQDKKGYSYLLTCDHVIVGAEAVNFNVYPKDRYPVPVTHHNVQCQWWTAKDQDLALIKVPFAVPRSVRLCKARPGLKIGDAVLSIGCGSGASPSCQVGKILGVDSRSDLIFDRGAVGGRSGGMLYSKEGVVGILARTGDDRTMAVHYQKIHAFIKACKQDFPLLPE